MKREIYTDKAVKKEMANLPSKVGEKFAHELDCLSYGLQPENSKPMKGFDPTVFELKKNGRPAYRLAYTIIDNAIYVLHVYSKTSDGTDKKHEETIKNRLKNI